MIDAATDKHLSIDEAISKGILDQAKGNYHNTLTGRLSRVSFMLWLCRFVVDFYQIIVTLCEMLKENFLKKKEWVIL